MRELIFNVDYEVVAFAFTLLLFIETGICYPREARKNQLFRVMSCMVIVTEGFDIVSAVTITYADVIPRCVNMFFYTGYFMSGLGLCFLFHNYIEKAIVPESGRSILLRENRILLIVLECCVLLNVFFGFFFSFGEDGSYLHGPLYLCLHLASLWYVFCGSVALIVNRELLKKSQIFSSILFVTLYYLAVGLQTFLVPNVYIIMPAASAMLVIAIFTLETPDFMQLQRTLKELTLTKQELELANEKFYNLAYTDVMTGLKNRTAYNARLEQLEQLDTIEAVIFLIADINNLKYLNDNLGHEIGDKAIVQAAVMLREVFTKGCQCYRIGGDEFAVIAYNMTMKEFQNSYECFLALAREISTQVDFPFSIASGYQLAGSLPIMDALRMADEKMYLDKQQGKKSRMTNNQNSMEKRSDERTESERTEA